MNKSLELFKQLTTIPHGSGETALMRDFLKSYATSLGARVLEDSAGNLLCYKGDNPKVCLQAHYDMVNVGRAPHIELCEESGWLLARDSSLGADNGAALACALRLLGEESELELLITNDEEIGMLGAKGLTLTPCAPLILNIDSECEHEIIVSCAGGYDLEIAIPARVEPLPSTGFAYTLETTGFKGGHSGIDIIKNHPNALIELAHFLDSHESRLLHLEGGEKSNSIPTTARALILAPKPLESLPSWLSATPFKGNLPQVAIAKVAILPLLLALHSGVYSYDEASQSVVDSLNVSLLRLEEGRFTLTLMGRANTHEALSRNLKRAQIIAQALGASEMKVKDFYPPWERAKESRFLSVIEGIYRDLGVDCRVRAIHAGLECAILQEKLAGKEFISIGPTILHPHSTRERLDLQSLQRFDDILCHIMKAL